MTASLRFLKTQFLAFLMNFCPPKICKRSSLRSQCWMRLFLWFSNTVHYREINPTTWIPSGEWSLKMDFRAKQKNSYQFEIGSIAWLWVASKNLRFFINLESWYPLLNYTLFSKLYFCPKIQFSWKFILWHVWIFTTKI